MVIDATVLAEPESTGSESVEATKSRFLDLFLISFLMLFLELTFIRWFGSSVTYLTFFTNIVLMACFLGMSVGLMSAGRRRDYVAWVLPLGLTAVTLSIVTSKAAIAFIE